jgi:predicted transcriptional regulator
MNDTVELDDVVLEGSVLRVRVGPESLSKSLARAKAAMLAVQAGKEVKPHFGIGFTEMGQMLAVFTPKRWQLIAALRAGGPATVRGLAQCLRRDYKNEYSDVAALEQRMAVQRLPDGRMHVPWAEIVMDLRLPEALAA